MARRDHENERDDDHDAVVIDLVAEERRRAAKRLQGMEFGFPTPCPGCGKPGYLDHIDLVRRRQYQHCPWCWSKWEVAEAELSSGTYGTS